jgi:pimeloyl-ACP methyl ester carboxylesterase
MAATALLACTARGDCGRLERLPGHEGQVLPFAVSPPASPAKGVALVLLAGGHGHVALDESGCPAQLKGNSLVRARPLLQARGYEVVTLDAPADRQGEDGLAGFRVEPAHAEDVGRVVRWLRERGARQVWLLGTSRGSISVVNAGARLSGEAAPDGLVISSVLSAGIAVARKPWAAHNVFDLPLERIRQPVLVLGHTDDTCPRSPPANQDRVVQRLGASARAQLISGGRGPVQGPDACEGRSPHGFWGQDAEMVEATLAFIETHRP